MPRVLLTGFEPFDGDSINPSAELARALDGRSIQGHDVVGVVLPCVFDAALAALKKHVRRVRPDLVICLGQAGGRTSIALERVAINVEDARIADNAGRMPIDEAVVRGGPVGYWSTLPIKAITLALREAGIAAEVSQSAGTFVCNHVFYGLMHLLAKKTRVRGGFVHVPFVPEQTARMERPGPSLAMRDQERAIVVVIDTAITTTRDVRASGGATHG